MTLQVGRGAQLTPVATPIVLSGPEFGRIPQGHACFAPHRQLLKRTVEAPFALFLTGS